jgi:hypothetical protein
MQPYRLLLLYLLLTTIALPALASAKPPTAENSAEILAGKVVEIMNSSGYTYMLVSSGGLQQWVAIPETTVAKGDRIRYFQGMTMNEFHSKTLNKTFASILFSAGLAETEKTDSPEQAPAAAGGGSFASALKAEQQSTPIVATPGAASGGSVGAVVPFEEIAIPKAEGNNAYTVGELFAKAKELQNGKVRVRGKVVKVSTAIMGRNWVHLQDGSGDPLSNSHDLVFTGEMAPEVGAIVVMEGVLAADKDFGAGYSYKAIVEQAAISHP